MAQVVLNTRERQRLRRLLDHADTAERQRRNHHVLVALTPSERGVLDAVRDQSRRTLSDILRCGLRREAAALLSGPTAEAR
jgi:hypothetical protein